MPNGNGCTLASGKNITAKVAKGAKRGKEDVTERVSRVRTLVFEAPLCRRQKDGAEV
jgi:hypothetical protein